MKSGIIDQMLLWFIIVLITVGFVATISDNEDTRVKHHKLKNITDNAALAAAKYYSMEHGSQKDSSIGKSDAQAVADTIVKEATSPLAASLSLNYAWDFSEEPYTVTASISNYTHENFWWRLFGLVSHELDVASTAQIAINPITSGTNVAPIAINNCVAPLVLAGDSYTLDLTAHDDYTDIDKAHFFALSDKKTESDFDCTLSDGDAQASFTQFKQIIDAIVKNKETDDTTMDLEQPDDYKPIANVCLEEWTSGEIDNDLKQASQSFGSSFPIEMSFITLACGSDANNLIYEKLISVSVTDVRYDKNGPRLTIDFDILSTGDPEVKLIK